MSTFTRQAGRLNFIVSEDLGTDSRSEGSVFHTQLSTPRFPQTESLGLTVVRTENGNYHFYKELSPQ